MPLYSADVWKLGPIVDQFLEYRSGLPLADAQIGVMLAVLAQRPEPVARFLDLGCGDGILGAAILNQYPGSRGVLVDFSEPMLVQARAKLAGQAGQLEVVNLDYATPDWTDRVAAFGPYDALVSGYSIHHQPDTRKRELYGEILQLLAPGGWFINVEHVQAGSAVSTRLFEEALIDGHYAAEQARGGSRTRAQLADEFYNRADRAANILAPADLQCNWLRELGYVDVDCFLHIYELAVFGGRRPDQAH